MNTFIAYIKNKSLIFLPKDSIRRFIVKIIYKILVFPFKIINKIIYQFIIIREYKSFYYSNYLKEKVKIIKAEKTLKNISDYEHITFKNENNPVVSIIIPVYNQFNYTYYCLKSIYDNSGSEVSYEIIIADDCSDDLTEQIGQVISNIIVVRTNENLRFLRNCNNAAKHANGKYILFLNNDTQVQRNWLTPMVELFKTMDNIGAVGSKLLFKNGLLQEAGGIIWKDSSGCNYGRMKFPGMPEYNYVKEVDYASGASLMIKRTIWEKNEGFDEYFAPAYCEDPDLCFSVRKMGYKVMYQPASVVVHFEGISNGIDITKGQKRFQPINQKKFYAKWKNVLEKENFPIDENIFYARDRRRNKKTLLFIDHCVPQFDKDAGSRNVFHYLSFFVNNGFNVKFIGDNFKKHESYSGILEQMGIEVLYGPYYKYNWKKWIRENGQYFDYVFLSRPHIAIKYISFIKKHTKAKIFYLGHDLHYLRESRENEIKNTKPFSKAVEDWKKMEYYLMKNADVSYFVSTAEIKIIKETDSSINCKAIPINIFPEKEMQIFDNTRKDLLFIGGFNHTPNVDAVLWFVDSILPVVRASLPDIVLYIIGSNVPDVIQKLDSPNIKIIGYVEDNILKEYYQKCRVSIAPLRYGAGVKGKVTEAMYNQTPVITTSIGAEGLPDIEDCLVIEDDPEKYANKLIEMYNNNVLLTSLTDKGFSYVKKHFTFESVINIFKEDFIIDNPISYYKDTSKNVVL